MHGRTWLGEKLISPAKSLLVGIIGAGAFSCVASGQSATRAGIDECRREALQEFNDSAASLDAQSSSNEEATRMWNAKASALVAHDPPHAVGRFGDPNALDNLARSPTRVAHEIQDEVAAALRAATESFGVYDNQVSSTPNDPTLYCDYLFSNSHKVILQHMNYYAATEVRKWDNVEMYFRIRIHVASGISAKEYESNLSSIKADLLDSYELEAKILEDQERVLKGLLKQ